MPTVPTGVLTIDWGNPLTSGLVGAYVPGGVNGGSNLADPGNGDVALYGTAVDNVSGTEGLGMQASGGAMAGTASTAQLAITAASLYWRGENPADGDGFANLIGPDAKADYDAPLRDLFSIRTNTFASDAFQIVYNDGAGAVWGLNGGAGLAAGGGVVGSIAATLIVSGLVESYRDGAFVASSSYGTAFLPDSDPTARMQIGGTDHFGRYSNTLTYVGYMWDRVLDATEMATLDADPYAFLVAPSIYMRPDADSIDGGWTNELGGTTLFSSIDESAFDDADYIQSSVNPSSDVAKIRLSNPSTAIGSPVKLRYRYKKDSAPAADLTVRLLQGVTQIAEWTHTGISTSFVTTEQTLTAPELASITDFDDLFIELEANS